MELTTQDCQSTVISIDGCTSDARIFNFYNVIKKLNHLTALMMRITDASCLLMHVLVILLLLLLQLAPDWPLKQEFIANWKAVTNYFVENKGLQ